VDELSAKISAQENADVQCEQLSASSSFHT